MSVAFDRQNVVAERDRACLLDRDLRSLLLGGEAVKSERLVRRVKCVVRMRAMLWYLRSGDATTEVSTQLTWRARNWRAH